MRFFAFFFASLLIFVQYPLWFGAGGWLKVRRLKEDLSVLRFRQEEKRERNSLILRRIERLKKDPSSIEEYARHELGMISKDEVFFRILDEEDLVASE